jgi:DNA polymerase I-like protein with 3'-5' exonuclease and polymerase domains
MAQVKGETKKVRLSDEEYQKACESPNDNLVRRDSEPFNLGSRKQIGEYLVEFGWKPTKFTPTGQPIVDEKVLSQIKNIPEAAVIAEYLMLQKRIAQINSWFKEMEDDGRIHGFVNTNGAVTGRMTHSSPNMAQVPSTSSPYGKECRECWTVEDNYRLVGIDASGLELRMLAHYMDDEDFTYELLNGDIHTANQMAAGLESRPQAKTFIYALLYGAGDAKLGSVVGGDANDGGRLRQSFFDNLPAFKVLKDRVSRAAKRGYLKGLDKRKLFVRSEHAALNTLLQGAGAIVMKQALVNLQESIKDLDAHFVANVHDEWQIEAHKDVADKVGELGVAAIEQAGKDFYLKCELTGEYNVGNNWADTH